MCRARGTTSSCDLVQGNHPNRNDRATVTTGKYTHWFDCSQFASNSALIRPYSITQHLWLMSRTVKCSWLELRITFGSITHIHHIIQWGYFAGFFQSRGNRHTLTIRNVTYNDLGNYTCQASNNLGKDRASLTLSGIPSVCTFDSVSMTIRAQSCALIQSFHNIPQPNDINDSHNYLQPTLSNHRDQYNISWVVQSYSPILEYRLFYRKQTSSGNANPNSNNDVIHYEKYVCNILSFYSHWPERWNSN